MTNFGEMAWENGFKDANDYLEYLSNQAAKNYTAEQDEIDDLTDGYEEQNNLIPTKKISLRIKNALQKVDERNYKVVEYLGLVLQPSDLEDTEVERNIQTYKLSEGDILEIMYTSKDDIIKYNKILGAETQGEILDDVFFIKHIDEANQDVWVGSCMKNSDEERTIIDLFKNGETPMAAITTLTSKRKYTYALVYKIETENNLDDTDIDEY